MVNLCYKSCGKFMLRNCKFMVISEMARSGCGMKTVYRKHSTSRFFFFLQICSLYLKGNIGVRRTLIAISRAECDTILSAYTMYRHLE